MMVASIDAALRPIDERATLLQRDYRRVVFEVVGGGFVALVFSFASVSFGAHLAFLILEAAGSVVMMAGIGEGLFRRRHSHWILERHRAERLRLLQFRWAIDPQHWDVPPERAPVVAAQLQKEVDAICTSSETDMERWLRAIVLPEPVLPEPAPSVERARVIKQSYLDARLNDQLNYFLHMSKRREAWDSLTRHLATGTFAVAVVLSLVNLVIEFPEALHAWPRFAPRIELPPGWLLFLILALPAAGAAARLLRTAFEFARNRERFVTTAAALHRAHGWLDVAREPEEVARAMSRAEEALEREHREWLRLMIEAEWFG